MATESYNKYFVVRLIETGSDPKIDRADGYFVEPWKTIRVNFNTLLRVLAGAEKLAKEKGVIGTFIEEKGRPAIAPSIDNLPIKTNFLNQVSQGVMRIFGNRGEGKL